LIIVLFFILSFFLLLCLILVLVFLFAVSFCIGITLMLSVFRNSVWLVRIHPRLALDLAADKGVTVPTVAAANESYVKVLDTAGDEDFSAVLTAYPQKK
jgi:ABC-type Na+ efflux pump permease subunit